MLTGVLFALTAGLMWGLVFVAPLLLPDYPALMLTVGRYLAFGFIAMPLAWLDRKALRALKPDDWWMALKLSLVGNFLYYLALSAAIQRSGAPLPTVVIGTLPVVIAICANLRSHQALPWMRLLPPLGLILLGIACVNQTELAAVLAAEPGRIGSYAMGALLAVAAVVCWTWYPMRNADWLKAHPSTAPRVWATAQGLVTLPLAMSGGLLLAVMQGSPWSPLPEALDLPLGPRPEAYVGLMLAIGLLSSWIGTLCWNEASQRLPTSLAGQLIVFETLAALAYAFALRGELPAPLGLLGIMLLVMGVIWALRRQGDTQH